MRLYAKDLIRIGSSGSYINNREITQRFRVDPGYYIIIPSTYDEDKSLQFMLRIYTEQLIEMKSLNFQNIFKYFLIFFFKVVI